MTGERGIEAAAKAAYVLGDHLHPWELASEDTRLEYEMAAALAATPAPQGPDDVRLGTCGMDETSGSGHPPWGHPQKRGCREWEPLMTPEEMRAEISRLRAAVVTLEEDQEGERREMEYLDRLEAAAAALSAAQDHARLSDEMADDLRGALSAKEEAHAETRRDRDIWHKVVSEEGQRVEAARDQLAAAETARDAALAERDEALQEIDRTSSDYAAFLAEVERSKAAESSLATALAERGSLRRELDSVADERDAALEALERVRGAAQADPRISRHMEGHTCECCPESVQSSQVQYDNACTLRAIAHAVLATATTTPTREPERG